MPWLGYEELYLDAIEMIDGIGAVLIFGAIVYGNVRKAVVRAQEESRD